MERCASAQDKVWACTHTLEQEERHVLSVRALSPRAVYIQARASGFVGEQRKSAREQGDSRSRITKLLSRYQNALWAFGSKITP